MERATRRRSGTACVFGAPRAGDPEQNYTPQYSDAARGWGTVDYLMPQPYWGQAEKRRRAAHQPRPWLAVAWRRCPGRRGCSCMRVGLPHRAGDGSDSGSEWVSGHALADQLALLARSGITGGAVPLRQLV